MKNIIVLLFMSFLVYGCAHNSVRERKIACVERFLEKNVDAIKGKDVCTWAFERN